MANFDYAAGKPLHIAPEIAAAVRDLSRQGMEIPVIAHRLGIPSTRVARILKGNYRDLPARFVRCPGCRGLVELPCKLCALDALPVDKKTLPVREPPPGADPETLAKLAINVAELPLTTTVIESL